LSAKGRNLQKSGKLLPLETFVIHFLINFLENELTSCTHFQDTASRQAMCCQKNGVAYYLLQFDYCHVAVFFKKLKCQPL
jgi:hypothetical protein